MKKNKNLRTICLSLVAMAMIITLSVAGTLAYFTAHTSAKGGVTLNLKFAQAEIEEEVNAEAGYKKIAVKNTGNVDCYVRVKAFAASECNLTYAGSSDGRMAVDTAKWNYNSEEGYYEYKESLKPGAATDAIFVCFTAPTDALSYNVIVIQEAVPVLHDNAGEELPANWRTKVGEPITFVGEE